MSKDTERTTKEWIKELKENPPWCLGCDRAYTLSISPLLWVCGCGDCRPIEPKTCGNCAYRSDGVNTKTPDYCYCHDMTVERDGICGEWRGSLRDEPLEGPPVVTKDVITYPLSAFMEDGDGHD